MVSLCLNDGVLIRTACPASRPAEGIPKIGGAIPAVIKRGVVQLREIAGEVHKASRVMTMFQIKEMPQFMQSHLGCPVKDFRRLR